jgi:hypothetical protein
MRRLGSLLVTGIATTALACSPTPAVPVEYRTALTRVCDAIDAYGESLSLSGSGSIIEQALVAETARKLAGDAFKAWSDLSVPNVPRALRTQVEHYRSAEFDLIHRPADLQAECRALEAALQA